MEGIQFVILAPDSASMWFSELDDGSNEKLFFNTLQKAVEVKDNLVERYFHGDNTALVIYAVSKVDL